MSFEKINLLEQFLETAQVRQKEFDSNIPDVKKADIAIDFQTKILEVLDYSYTNLPVSRKKLKDYCPRPKPGETQNDFILRGKHKTSLPILEDFLSHFFEVNHKYNEAISFIVGKVKHEKANDFGKNTESKLNGKLLSSHPEPIKRNPDGSLEIAGGIAKIDPMSSGRILNSVFTSSEGITIIESLEFAGAKFEGGIIILRDGEKREFFDWSNDCISICKEIIDYRKKG